jgi:hypothetical protein
VSTTPQNSSIDIAFTKAVKYESRLKLALESESGGGKTLTALILASRIAKHRGGRIALADSEHTTALLYADLVDFDHFPMPDHKIETYLAVMDKAEKLKYSVLVMDSTSHVWNGKGGALQEVNETAEQHRTSRGAKNSWGAWAMTRPKLNLLVDRINELDIDLICTFRQKRKTQQSTQSDGSTKIENVGVEMIGPNDIEYEFTILCDLIRETNDLVVTKTRCPRLKGKVFHALKNVEPIDLDSEEPTATHGMIDIVVDWLKGKPIVKQSPPLTGVTKAFAELHDRFTRLKEEPLWDQILEKHGLDWHFAGRQMEDPSIADRSRIAFKILKATITVKELESTVEPMAATQQSSNPQVSPVVPIAKQEPEPVPVSPIAPAAPEAQPTPVLAHPPLGINDFSKQEIDGLFRAAKTIRPKGYNRASFVDELQTYRGTRDDFFLSIMDGAQTTGDQA